MDDPFFQPGNVALADAQCVGGLLLGTLNAVRQTKAQLHDLPFPRGQAVHGPAQHGTPDEFFAHPQTKRAQDFLNSIKGH